MPTPRSQFHLPPTCILDDSIVIPVGPLYKRLRQELRLAVRDHVRCFDGVGNVYVGTIAHINAEGILIRITERSAQVRPNSLTLAIAILDNSRMKLALEYATKLSVARIIPLLTERTEKSPAKPSPRWQNTVLQAAEWSGQAWLPEIGDIQTFKATIAQPGTHVVCTPNAIDPLPTTIAPDSILYIGPAGGFTDAELQRAEKHGALLGHLGSHRLGSDTAATVALARAQAI